MVYSALAVILCMAGIHATLGPGWTLVLAAAYVGRVFVLWGLEALVFAVIWPKRKDKKK
jgi:uncharacterized membrane protein HdeD (DUF308 family)